MEKGRERMKGKRNRKYINALVSEKKDLKIKNKKNKIKLILVAK